MRLSFNILFLFIGMAMLCGFVLVKYIHGAACMQVLFYFHA